MPNPRLASRYAKSLIDLSIERGQLEAVYNDMLYLQQLTKGSRDFLNMLRSPVISADKKRNVINALTAGKINDLTAAFTKLLIDKGRENEIPEIITAFVAQYKQKKGIHIIKLTTANEVSEEIKNNIIAQVRKTTDFQSVELETVVDPKIIGGFILQTGDKLVDASVARDLKEISREFENNDFIYKVR